MSDDDDEEGFFFTKYLEQKEEEILDDAMQKRISEETFLLAKDRLYIIFDPVSLDKVNVRAYDSSDCEDVTAAHILQQGMLSLLETDYDYLMQLGHEATIDQIKDLSESYTKKAKIEDVYDNVIKVRFSEDN